MSRSFRLHRPRGAYCGRGWCRQCPLRGEAGEPLACKTPAAEAGDPSLFAPLRPAGKVAERLHPWFFERLLRGPAKLRQRSLDAIRTMSGAGELPVQPAPAHGTASSLVTDSLVVGGGPAGMGAAIALAASGRSVLLLEAERVGGSWAVRRSCEEDLRRTKVALGTLDVDVREATTCLGLYEEEGIAAAVGPSGPLDIRYETLVVATGAYDRPLLFSGNDLPGILGLRAFESYVSQGAFDRRDRIVVFGGPGELERAVAIAAEGNLEPACIATPAAAAPVAGALYGKRLRRARGRRQISAVEFSDGTRVGCDYLVLGFTQPTWELAAAAGIPVGTSGEPPVLVPLSSSNERTVVVGEAAGHLDVASASADAEQRVRAWLEGKATTAQVSDGAAAPSVVSDDSFICFCEDVRVRDVKAAVTDGFTHTELLKRRTGISTGPCQGKLCMPPFLEVATSLGVTPVLPTTRPPLRPVRLADLGSRSE